MSIQLASPQSARQWQIARELVQEYAASLDVDLTFQHFAQEIEQFTSEYGPPSGAFLLAEESADYLGCAGVRRFSADVGEIKRLYVRPAGRGRGIGRMLAEGIIAVAPSLGFTRLVLDTLPFMHEAQALYVSLGFKPTAPYRYNPVVGSAYLELIL